MEQAYQFKITLLSPYRKIWRRVQIPVDIDFGTFHAIIQVAMGWEDAHLHEFEDGKRRISQANMFEDEMAFFDNPGLDEDTVALTDIFKRKGKKILYTYDFGDSWSHEVLYEGKIQLQQALGIPMCVAGEGACPPEDCGGIYGYEEVLKEVNDPEADEQESWKEWLGEDFDPGHFDPEEVNDIFRQWAEVGEEEAMELIEEMLEQVPEEVLIQAQELFSGLDVRQMGWVVTDPLSPESPLKFAEQVPDELLDSSPYLRTAEYLIAELASKGELKLTTTGNLPLKFAKSFYENGIVQNEDIERGILKPRSETELEEVHTVRLLLEIGKLVKKRNNKMSLTQNGKKLVAAGRTALFQRLIEIFLLEFNMGYWDGYGDTPIGQYGVFYVLYLLKVHGKKVHEHHFYVKKYQAAFPMLMDSIEPRSAFQTAEGLFETVFTLRTFQRGLSKWGLIELKRVSLSAFEQKFEVRGTALLDGWIAVGKE